MPVNIKPTYEPTINLGSLLTTISVLVAAGSLWFQVTGMWASVTTNLARFDVRTTNLETNVSEIRSGMRQIVDTQIKFVDRQVIDAKQDSKLETLEKKNVTLEQSMTRMWERLNTLERERLLQEQKQKAR